MAIKLRINTGSALTYKDMDRNFSSFFYSASVDTSNYLQLWYTGSSDLNGSDGNYEPRYVAINLQPATSEEPVTSLLVAGDVDGQIQYKKGSELGASSTFTYLSTTGLLGVGTSVPTARLHVKGNSTYPALIKLESATSGATKKSAVEFYQGTEPIGVIGRDNSENNNIYIKTNQSDGKLVFNIGSSTNESGLTTTGLGIGTISPQKALHVLGEGYFTTKVSVGDYAGPEALRVYQATQLGGNLGSYQDIAKFSIIPTGNNINNINITAVRIAAGGDHETSGMRIQQLVDSSYMGYLQFGGVGNVEGISIGTGGSTTGPLGGAIVERLKITNTGAVTITNIATAAANNTSAVVVSAAGLIQKIDAAPVPKGGIIMWSGTIASKPAGWHLCDGNNGTPNLTNKFVIGANADDAGVAKTTVTGTALQTGGTKDAVVVDHNHDATSGISPNPHSHSLPGDTSGNQDMQTVTSTPNSDEGYNTGITTGNTSLTVSTSVGQANGGVSGTDQNLPPFYALAYIMYGGIA